MRHLGNLCTFGAFLAVVGIAESLSLSDFFGYGPQESQYPPYHPAHSHGPPRGPPPKYRGPVSIVTYSKPSYGLRPSYRYVQKKPSQASISPFDSLSGWGGPSSGSSSRPKSMRPRKPSRPQVMMMVQDDEGFPTTSLTNEEQVGNDPNYETEDVVTTTDLTNVQDSEDPNSEFENVMVSSPQVEEEYSMQDAPVDDENVSVGGDINSISEEPAVVQMQSRPRRPTTGGMIRVTSGKRPSSAGGKSRTKSRPTPPPSFYVSEDDEEYSAGFPSYLSDLYNDDAGGWGWQSGPSSPPSSGGSSRPPPSSGGSGPPPSSGGSGPSGSGIEEIGETSEGGPGGSGIEEEGIEPQAVRVTSRPKQSPAARQPSSSLRTRPQSAGAQQRPATSQGGRTAQRPQQQATSARRPQSGSLSTTAQSGRTQSQQSQPQGGYSASTGRSRPVSPSSTAGRSQGQQTATGNSNSGRELPSTSQFRESDSGSEGVRNSGNLQMQQSISSDNQELSNLSGQLDDELLQIVQRIISETKV